MHSHTHDHGGLNLLDAPSELLLPQHSGLEVVRHDIMLPDSVSGYDQGTNERADAVFQTLDGADLNSMWREYQQTLAIRNAQRDRLVNFLTYTVSDPIEYVQYPTAENFEEATEYGEPVGIRLGPKVPVGFPFRWYDLAIRYTWQHVLESTQEQLDALNNEALEADDRLVFNQVFKTMFNSLDITSSVRNIPVTVYKFWNGDGQAPPTYKNNTFDGTHNHYITSGGATINSAAITSIEDHLYHHGYSLVNGYAMVLLVNRQEGKVLRGARVSGGWGYDFIPGPAFGGQIFLPAAMGIAGPAPASANVGELGRQQIGQYGPFSVIEEDYIPAGYVGALASKGAENLGNPIGIREHQNASARGLKLIKGDDTYPLLDSFYRHGFGAGIRHRGGGVVMQITASGSYTIPTAYV